VDNAVVDAPVDNTVFDNQDQNQTIDEISRRKSARELPNSDKFPKFANITRPQIAVNCDMQLRKRKLNGFQSIPINKAVVKNQVSKTIIIKIIHESVKILDANCHCLDFSISLAKKRLHT
jgi:hypothetical protein